jgi:hypothetical protein
MACGFGNRRVRSLYSQPQVDGLSTTSWDGESDLRKGQLAPRRRGLPRVQPGSEWYANGVQ